VVYIGDVVGLVVEQDYALLVRVLLLAMVGGVFSSPTVASEVLSAY
jgi:hypothetical protein